MPVSPVMNDAAAAIPEPQSRDSLDIPRCFGRPKFEKRIRYGVTLKSRCWLRFNDVSFLVYLRRPESNAPNGFRVRYGSTDYVRFISCQDNNTEKIYF